MLTCPLCKKSYRTLVRECPSCRSDLTLLADFVTYLQEGLAKAEALAKAGELGEATWAYLAVLEVDPENAVARKQVSLVATAVRQFDRTAPPRRWLRLRGDPEVRRRWLVGALVVAGALVVGFFLGRGFPPAPPDPEEPAPREENTLK